MHDINSNYEAIAAGESGYPLGNSGAAGDYLDKLVITVKVAATAAVSIKDGVGAAISVFPNSPGGGIGRYVVKVGATSQSGPWRVTTGTGSSVVAVGNFSSAYSPSFRLGFADLGSGEVSLVPLTGAVAATFTRATTATTVLSTGLIGSVASGVPRSYYDPATLAYQGYLAEGSRTNICLQSEDFATTWAAVGTPTFSADTGSAGILTLDTIGDDSAAALEGYTQTVTFTGDATKVISVFVKQGTSTSSVIRLRDTTAPADRLLAAVTWSGSVPVVTMTTGTDLTGTPKQYGTTGVYRLSFLTTAVTAANTNSLQVYPATAAALEVANTGTLLAGGVQAEDAAFASSYIPTTTAAVTRNADVLTYPLTGWYNAVEGTVFVGAQQFSATGIEASVSLRDAVSDYMSLFGSVTSAVFQSADGGVIQFTMVLATPPVTSFYKMCGAYKANDIAAYTNGTTMGTDAVATISTPTLLEIGSDSQNGIPFYGSIKQVAYYNTRLAGAKLQEMTS